MNSLNQFYVKEWQVWQVLSLKPQFCMILKSIAILYLKTAEDITLKYKMTFSNHDEQKKNISREVLVCVSGWLEEVSRKTAFSLNRVPYLCGQCFGLFGNDMGFCTLDFTIHIQFIPCVQTQHFKNSIVLVSGIENYSNLSRGLWCFCLQLKLIAFQNLHYSFTNGTMHCIFNFFHERSKNIFFYVIFLHYSYCFFIDSPIFLSKTP